MKKLLWKIRFTWHMCKLIGFKANDISFSWYNATVWVDDNPDEYDDLHPHDAVWEEMSCWDAE